MGERMYRFGDGTPFPLRENFIETLVAAVDCCVALYQVEAKVEDHHARVRDAGRLAAEEAHRLDALQGLIDTALAPLMTGQDRHGSASEQAAARIAEAATTIIKNSRTSVSRRRDTAARQTIPPAVLETVPSALARFFRRHQMPRTEWHARWQAAQEGAAAEITALATRHLELVFRASFASGFWSQPIPMADLFPGPVTAIIEGARGRARQVRLDPTLLTELQVAPGREAMVLRETGKRPGPGLHILMPRPGELRTLVVALDKRDQSRGQPFYLDDASAAAVMGAWRSLERELPALVAGREELVAARLNGRAVSELEHPAQLAEAILLSLASLVREIRMRSRVPGELILKRDLAADRREEIFVPRQVLWSKLSRLSPRHRELFEAIGLGDEATQEYVRRVTKRGAGADGVALEPARPGQRVQPDRAAGTPPSQPAQSGAEDIAQRGDDEPEPLSEVEVTNPRGEETSEVVSGIIDRASA
jgi:hypothetical protein